MKRDVRHGLIGLEKGRLGLLFVPLSLSHWTEKFFFVYMYGKTDRFILRRERGLGNA